MKAVYHRPTACIESNGEKLKAFSLRQSKIRMSLSTLCVSLEVLARAIREEEEIKDIKIGNEEIELSTFEDHIILYMEKLKHSKLINLLNQFSKAAGYKINIQNSSHKNKSEIMSFGTKMIPAVNHYI